MVCKNLSLSGCIRAQAKEIDGVLMYPQNFGEYSGAARARSHCCCAPPHIHFIPDLPTYSVPLFLKRQCDRTLGVAGQEVPVPREEAGWYGYSEAPYSQGAVEVRSCCPPSFFFHSSFSAPERTLDRAASQLRGPGVCASLSFQLSSSIHTLNMECLEGC